MPRLQVIDPAFSTGAVREIFDGPLKGKHFNIFKGLANSPAALKAILEFKSALAGGVLTPAEREIIALTVGELNGCDYCVAAHTALGKKVGLTEDQTVAARKGDSLGDPRLDAFATFVRTLHETRGVVGDSDLDAVKGAGYSDEAIVEIIANYAENVLTNFFNNVNESVVDFPAVPALV
ncbi:MAG: carboxymuconolactone decarboxylase family protein [Phycisphaeraceae bacterium]|nr:carboxymuconolactone decarboxylase family protein [Phycisphaeraceae bacterium]MCB9847774.1 carboxymuconolactone decarboxylase family protein [Phycisphaeraceae bacterium]